MKKCESGGCRQFPEFYDPMGNKLCSDCLQSEIETGEYTWEECEVIFEHASQPKTGADGAIKSGCKVCEAKWEHKYMWCPGCHKGPPRT